MGRTNPTKVRRHVSGNLNFNVIWDPSLARRRKKSLNHLDDARPTRNRIIRPDFDKTRFSQSAGEDISINARFEPELTLGRPSNIICAAGAIIRPIICTCGWC
jgi:hypothetical protein